MVQTERIVVKWILVYTGVHALVSLGRGRFLPLRGVAKTGHRVYDMLDVQRKLVPRHPGVQRPAMTPMLGAVARR